uniref:Dienelactone hydrolase domain-containing protein n=1 Tax=Chromera velia CCMP2878 TaxID=1169474 RepID=A0A0G4HN60_9ALVE|eukprot:Cvel_29493.t1-p1 / transcript=Cvel_29493.t1 / gene=Cvel_29493 / organism=Chromera_velia_CCMP2878 / gene_product=Protein usf, putative / transcript_product=Protein usf, putative / location=Cvel_scaffold4050:288-4041(+) / protein_length=161 / sequence_SO=supercontig / SO=protein_coding / is_pseudo=false
MTNLDFPQAVEEIKQTAEFLKQEGATKIGVTGFCMGGALTIAAGVKCPDHFACAAPFYGVPPQEYFDYSTMKVPVQAHFGAEDKLEGFSDPATAKKLEEALKKAGCEHEVHLYDGVGHAFMNGMVPEWQEKKKALGFGDHVPAQVEMAWERLFGFLGKHLS